ncbi:unnamed protein product [Angiostrongylus costaricensis]|uniref:Venom dipeptidyl peptidase 4 n=1 Tax=Angiostrongylus costaricensis TaxID=334426 RepID=A0A158PKI0_ANGCS|nr:unnamed protein product [Angiostrongylus costaricensis]
MLVTGEREHLSSSTVTLVQPGTFDAVEYPMDASLVRAMSSNRKYAYITQNTKEIFRHSNEELYEVFRIVNGTRTGDSFAVGPKGNGFEAIHSLEWNPNPNKNDFIFVHDYNIYYQDDPEKPGSAVKLTPDGNYLLRYGVPDWLYEEEILLSGDAIWWADSGDYVAYLRFDDRLVNRIYIPEYFRGSQYPQYIEIPYPKAGVKENPLITLYIWKVSTKKSVIIEPPLALMKMNQSYYVFTSKWLKMPIDVRRSFGFERLLTVWATREQNLLYITLCNDTDCLLTYTQSFTINGQSMWAEPSDFKQILASRVGFFVILPHAYHDGNIYNHIAHIQILKNGSGRITSWHGESYDIHEIKAYNMKSDTLTFTSAGGAIGTMQLYKSSVISLSSFILDCDYGSFDVSPDGRRVAASCLQPFRNTKMYLMDIDIPSNNKLLEGADETHIPFDLPELSFELMELPSNYGESDFKAHVGIMKPPMFDPTMKYPLLVDVYGGPNSCRVRRVTPNSNMIYFCSHLNAIVVWIDGRGASNRGWNLKSPVYKALGQYETQDTIDAVKLLISKYSFIDEQRVAIFGWSYGGFVSTYAGILDQGKTFKCAIAVAPVSNFMLYDSAYTERYLGVPLENPTGYNATQLLNKAGLLKNVKYMLAHGEADDNVHFQNSALLSEKLQAELVHFTQLVYSNQDHNIGTRQAHLFMEIDRFLTNECFNDI